MCTSIAFPGLELYGRNLDLEYHFGEKVVNTVCASGFPEDRYLVFCTRNGLFKKTSLSPPGPFFPCLSYPPLVMKFCCHSE